MTASAVSASMRFTRSNPCPICGGGHNVPKGHGIRCWGFLSSDGLWAHCTVDELAGPIDVDSAETYPHRLVAECRCGHVHGAAVSRYGHPPSEESTPADHELRRRRVEAIWKQTKKASGQACAMNYMLARGLDPERIPPSIRFHPRLAYRHDDTERRTYHPALVFGIQDIEGHLVGLQRVYLSETGEAKADVPDSKKMMTVRPGASSGAAIRFGDDPEDVLLLGEGMENSLSVWQATGLPTWSCISAPGLEHVIVPVGVGRIEIWSDHDGG